MTPIVTVIIINRNTRPLLAVCLDTIQKTIPPLIYETIVVDNGSTDESVAFLLSLGSQIHLVRNEQNLGYAKAVNQAIEIAIGKYLLILNTDIMLAENAVAQFIEFIEKTPDAGMVGGQLLNSDGSNQNSIAPFPTLITELIGKSLLRFFYSKKYYHKTYTFKIPVAVDSLVGAAFLVRKEAIDTVGKMDERFSFISRKRIGANGLSNRDIKSISFQAFGFIINKGKVYILRGLLTVALNMRYRDIFIFRNIFHQLHALSYELD